uniref:Signal peptidase complex subunit 1 n=3 Tax=Braconidae TaxID=7402 RepID=A0A0C9R5S7_9HYME
MAVYAPASNDLPSHNYHVNSFCSTYCCCNCCHRYTFLIMASLIQSIKSIPTHMDYEGQARAEKLSRIIVTLFGFVGLIWGYAIQEFSQALYILGAGCVMAAIITVPPWPMYRRNPLDWQKPQTEALSKSKKKK